MFVGHLLWHETPWNKLFDKMLYNNYSIRLKIVSSLFSILLIPIFVELAQFLKDHLQVEAVGTEMPYCLQFRLELS